MAQPDLNFIAPEVQLHKTCTPLSDMFSVGMVICSIYNSGHSLINADHNPNLYVKQMDQVGGQSPVYSAVKSVVVKIEPA